MASLPFGIFPRHSNVNHAHHITFASYWLIFYCIFHLTILNTALTLLVERQEEHPACKKMTGARFAYGPAVRKKTSSSLARLVLPF